MAIPQILITINNYVDSRGKGDGGVMDRNAVLCNQAGDIFCYVI